jgi:predicted ester cyclase
MSLEDNKEVIRAYVETIFNQKQVDRAGELVAPDYVDHAALPGQAPGLEGVKPKWAMYLAGIPDLRVTIEELVAEGDKVAVRRSYAGTHRGELLVRWWIGHSQLMGGRRTIRWLDGTPVFAKPLGQAAPCLGGLSSSVRRHGIASADLRAI